MDPSTAPCLRFGRALVAGLAGLLTMVVFWVGFGWIAIVWSFSHACFESDPCPQPASPAVGAAYAAFLVASVIAPVVLGGLITRLTSLVRLGWVRTIALTVVLAAVPVFAVAAGWAAARAGAGGGPALVEGLAVGAVSLTGWAVLARVASHGRPSALPTAAAPRG